MISRDKGHDGGCDAGKGCESIAHGAHLLSGGEVAPGYEVVCDMFLSNFTKGGQEDRAQCCAYVRGRKVVDIWASRISTKMGKWGDPARTYGPTSIQNVWSSTKVIESLVVAMLVDRGHLRYQQTISELWPEYAAHGKGSTTVAQLMRHEAGLPEFDRILDASDLTTDAIKSGRLSDIIAAQKPVHVPGERRVYHALTRGWIVNELVRRADPNGRTVGEFVLHEISEPLGLASQLRIGLPDELHGRVAPLTKRPSGWDAKQLLLPKRMGGGRMVGLPAKVRSGLICCLPVAACVGKAKVGKPWIAVSVENGKTAHGIDGILQQFNTAEVRRCEIPSANGHASARALAIVACTMAQEGETFTEGGSQAQRVRLVSREGMEAALGDLDTKEIFGGPMAFSNAGWCAFGEGRKNYAGWMGLGGSACQWHHGERIGFGYAMNAYEYVPWNARAQALQELVLECASRDTVPQDWQAFGVQPELKTAPVDYATGGAHRVAMC